MRTNLWLDLHHSLYCFASHQSLCAGEKGSVWSFNYFFYNKKLKKILYFSCRGRSKTAADSLNNTSSGVGSQERSEDEDENATRYGMANSMDL